MRIFNYTLLFLAALSLSVTGCKKDKNPTSSGGGGGGGGSNDNEYVLPSSGDNTITTCSGVIRDHAGDENYDNNIDGYTVIVPSNADDNVQLSFTSFELEGCCDFVTVFDGIGTGGSELFNGNGTTLPPTITASNGPLTIRHTSDFSETFAGFEATISCVSGGGDDTFDCISGNCFNVGSGGAFSSQADCEANCGGSSDTFDCISGNCFNVGSGGTFSSQADCEANCGGSSDTFNCVSGNCVNVGSGGTFSSLADCQNNCGGSSSDCCDCTGIGFTCDICCDGEFDMFGESWDTWLALFEQSGCDCE